MFLTILTGQAQQTDIQDSVLVERQLAQANTTGKIRLLHSKINEYRNTNSQVAYKYAKRAIEFSQIQADSFWLAASYYQLSSVLLIFADYQESFRYVVKCQGIAERNHYDSLLVWALDRLALYQSLLEPDSLRNSNQSYRQREQQIRQRALALAQKFNSPEQLIRLYTNIGDTYRELERFDSALFYTKKVLELSQATNNRDTEGFAYLNFGQIYLEQKDLTKALEFATKAYNFLDSKNHYDASFARLLQGIVYKERKEYKKAFELFEKALHLSRIVNARDDVKGIYEQMFLTAEKMGNINLAYHYYKLHNALSDSLIDLRTNGQIAALQDRSNIYSKESQIRQLKMAEEQQQKIAYLLTVGLIIVSGLVIIASVFAFMLYRQKQSEKQKNDMLLLQNAEILSQREEINAQNENIRKQKEELEKVNAELHAIDEEKNQIIGIVAHDLRSPLNQIKGLLTIFQMLNPNADSEVVAQIEMMNAATDRMTTMISQILDANAVDAHTINISPEDVPISEITHTIVLSFAETAKSKNISINSQITPNLVIRKADVNYLTQVVENLLSNAIKYSPMDKEVSVKVHQAHNAVRIEVKDYGNGLSEADQRKLFGKFQRLSAKPTAGEKSLGLGLFIVKKYIDAMGGKVWCESQLGQGATFIVEFGLTPQ